MGLSNLVDGEPSEEKQEVESPSPDIKSQGFINGIPVSVAINSFLEEYDEGGNWRGPSPPKKSEFDGDLHEKWIDLTDEWEGIVGFRKKAECPCGYWNWMGWQGFSCRCIECRRVLIDTEYDEWQQADGYEDKPTKEGEVQEENSGMDGTKMSGLSDWQ